MTINEAIKTIEVAIAEVEWEYPMSYAVAFEMAIAALRAQQEAENIDGLQKKRGKWVSNELGGYKWGYVCSECGWLDGYPFNDRHNFCPNCGMKMEGD